MTHKPPRCHCRPQCGGATVCVDCVAEGVSRTDLKLLRGSVKSSSLPDVVHSVWPEASSKEAAVIANQIVRLGIARPKDHGALDDVVEHRLWPLLRDMQDAADNPLDPIEFAKSRGAGEWALPLLTSARLAESNMHVFSQPGTSRVLVRRKTFLNAIHSASLAKALRAQGICGTPLETVYKEYDRAFDDLFNLVRRGVVTIDENMAWHHSAVPKATPGALGAWQRALALYKPK